MKRGRKTIAEKLYEKNSNDLCTSIPLSIKQSLLSKVMNNIEGNGRSDRICTCIRKGYEQIMGVKP